MTFKIFVSYSQEDYKAHARRVHNYLSKIISNSSVFIDQIKPKGEKWREKNDEELLNSDLMILLVTPAALQSSEVLREIELANQNNIRILTCKPEDLDMDWNDLPWNLGDVDGIEFEDDEILKIRLVREINNIIKRNIIIPENFQPSTYPPLFEFLNVRLGNHNFPIKYGIQQNSLAFKSWEIDRDSCSLSIHVQTFMPTGFTITLPRELIDAKSGFADSEFFVLLNGEEVDFVETMSENERTLKFLCPKKTSEIEVIGNQIMGILYGISDSEEYEINICKGASNPENEIFYDFPHLEIHRGDSVTWKNQEDSMHTITSGTPDDGANGIFDSSAISSQAFFSLTFERNGVYLYFDMIHPWMTGSISVID